MSGVSEDHRQVIVHVISTDARRGAEVFALELASGLDKSFDSRVFALAPADSSSKLDVEVLGPRWWSLPTLVGLRQAMRSGSVVVAHGSVTLPATVLAGLGLRTPIVYKNIGDPWYWASSVRRRLQTIVLLRRVAHVAALTPSAAKAVESCWKVSPDKISVTGGGREITQFSPPTARQRAEARAALRLGLEDEVVLYLGALSAEKRPELAVRAVLELPNVKLLVAGGGPLKPRVEALAVDDPERISVLGARSDVALLLQAADVVLLTSASEGLPGVLIEAGLTGLPVVAADVGFVKDVVEPGRTGLVVASDTPSAYAAAISEALRNRRTMGNAARERCLSRFDASEAKNRWAVLLRGVANRNR